MLEGLKSIFKRPSKDIVVFDLPIEIDSPQFSDQKVQGLTNNKPATVQLKSTGLSHFSYSRADYLPAQYDHTEIEVVFDIESFFARATRAKLALFSKEGWQFTGKNEQRVSYIITRIKQIERATKITFFDLMIKTIRDLIVHSNAFWVKVRNEKSSGGKVRMDGNRKIVPVAGYFHLSPVGMMPKVDANGNVVGWRQEINSGYKDYSSDEIIHFYYNKKIGYPLGVPTVVPSLSDIHALRAIEDNLEVLIRKKLFPLILYTVGTPDHPGSVYTDGDTEIEYLQEQLADLPPEGILVVPFNHSVKSIGAEGQVLSIEPYLKHFRERIFAGLDVSSIDMGIGETATRSSADQMSRNLTDVVKHLQQVAEGFINLLVIEELLLESTFPEESVLDLDNLVKIKFREIDTEAKTKKENHAVALFNSNAITYSELREELGREPLSKQQMNELWWPMFGLPQNIIRSSDEQYQTIGTSYKEPNKVVTATPTAPVSSTQTPVAKKVAAVNEPTNQHGTRSGPKIGRNSYQLYGIRDAEELTPEMRTQSSLMKWHLSLRDEFKRRVKEGKFSIRLAEVDITTTYDLAMQDHLIDLRKVIRSNSSGPELTSYVSKEIEKRTKIIFNRFKSDLLNHLKDNSSDPESVFNALQYRVNLIDETEKSLARNLTIYHLAKETKSSINVVKPDGCCDVCASKLTKIQWDDNLLDNSIPPFHPNCSCRLEIKRG